MENDHADLLTTISLDDWRRSPEIMRLLVMELQATISEQKIHNIDAYCKERQSSILKLNCMGTWESYFHTGQVVWNDHTFHLLGIDLDVVPNAETFRQRVHPDDIEVLDNIFYQAIVNKTQYNHEFRVNLPDGQIRWLQCRGEMCQDKNGVEKMLGIVFDISTRKKFELALQESETRLRNLATNIPGAIFRYIFRANGTDAVLFMSGGCSNLWEVEAEIAEKDVNVLWKLVHSDDVSKLSASILKSRATLTAWYYEYRIITPSGKLKWLQAGGQPQGLANGDVVWDTIILDITQRKLSEIALVESEERYRLLAENSHDLICLHDPDLRFSYVSPSCFNLLGYNPDELIGQDPFELFHPDDHERMTEETLAQKVAGQEKPAITRMRHRDGHYLWLEILAKPIEDSTGQTIKIQTTSRDVSERVQAQERLKHDAMHDGLTGLPNRNLLIERLELAIQRSKRSENFGYAVLFFDLDRFKVINDSFGHLVGDQLLITVGNRVKALLREIDLATRLGGDEFVVLLEEVNHLSEAIHVTERVLEHLSQPFLIDGREMFVTASIGIVLGSSHYHQSADILRDGDIAMYQAKARGKARYEIFDAAMYAEILHRLRLENDLRHALDREEFRIYYQPILDLDTGHLHGFEALIRWQHPEKGLVTPKDFMAIAEETYLIVPMDRWVLHTACEQLAQWRRQFPQIPPFKMSVNLSALDLWSDQLIDEIRAVTESTQLPGQAISLEITESMLVENVEKTIALLNDLNALGVQISIDDFGTGYSSLNYLYQFPVHALKIDRSFIDSMQNSSRSRNIVQTIITLSQQLGIQSIAEGAESPEQLANLKQLGCGYAQGYLLAPPLPLELATHYLESHCLAVSL